MTKAQRAAALKPGSKWKHYKGGEYVVLMMARIEATQEDAVVYAQTLMDLRPVINWVRGVDNFLGTVINDKRKLVHRFELME